ncbi:MAG: tetratricopeptide repeat protein [Bacteroidetes bacterium]|nr:tetratricopeptide repeat protein [Bacteroidota bacterium]
MQLSKSTYFYFTFLFFTVMTGFAQKDAKLIYDGNNMYHSGQIPQSATKYAHALEENPTNRKANFNLGNALYKNAQLIKSGQLSVPNSTIMPDSLANMVLDQAAQNFAVVANSISDKDTLHQAWHNIGNCYLLKKDYQQAVDAYKKALKFDSKDEETRYNLAYALKHLPPKQKGGGGAKPQPQEQKQDNKNQEQQQSQMSKEQAEQLLKAMMDKERKLQDKRKPKDGVQSKNVDKDW